MGLVWPYTGRVRPKVEGAVRGGVQLRYGIVALGQVSRMGKDAEPCSDRESWSSRIGTRPLHKERLYVQQWR
jgi:hypothetical protein